MYDVNFIEGGGRSSEGGVGRCGIESQGGAHAYKLFTTISPTPGPVPHFSRTPPHPLCPSVRLLFSVIFLTVRKCLLRSVGLSVLVISASFTVVSRDCFDAGRPT